MLIHCICQCHLCCRLLLSVCLRLLHSAKTNWKCAWTLKQRRQKHTSDQRQLHSFRFGQIYFIVINWWHWHWKTLSFAFIFILFLLYCYFGMKMVGRIVFVAHKITFIGLRSVWTETHLTQHMKFMFGNAQTAATQCTIPTFTFTYILPNYRRTWSWCMLWCGVKRTHVHTQRKRDPVPRGKVRQSY